MDLETSGFKSTFVHTTSTKTVHLHKNKTTDYEN